MHTLQTNKPNLYLTGFMGTGKSVIGRRVATSLQLEFYDSDSSIETTESMSVKDIFSHFGEGHFRKLEREFIDGGHPCANCVIACGGGLAVQPGMMSLLRMRGIVVSLFASVDAIMTRAMKRDTRPLLQGEDPELKIKTLLGEREQTYLEAGLAVFTDNRSIPEIVNHVRRIYLRECSNFTLGREFCEVR